MASERIPACASCLVANAAPHMAEVIRRIRQEPEENWQSLVDQGFDSARESLYRERLLSILGPKNDWSEEALVSAIKLSNEAFIAAIKDQRVWDRRRTAKTLRELLHKLANDHVRRWMEARGMDVSEAARLRDGGGE